MATLDTLRDHIKETSLFSGRIIAALIITLLMVSILVARMVYLQVYSHNHYTTLSQNNRVSVLPIAPTRGLIYDRNGVLLAQNIPSFTLEIVPEKIADLDGTLEKLGGLIDISTEELNRFHKLRKRSSRFKTVPLKYRLSESEVARFAARGHLYPGVSIEARLIRHYPQGKLGVHALGYVGRINEQELQNVDTSNYNGTTHIGKTGIERSYEDLLHGTVGFQRVETSARGRIVRVLEEEPSQPGQDILLTMDAEVQRVAEDTLGEQRGAVVALDVRTGGVLALASMPHYDPNLFVNGIDSKTYRGFTKSANQPLFNRAIRGRYPPGSTIKPLMGLAGLEHKEIHAGTRIDCPGWYTLPNDDHRYRDWKKEGHGHTTLRGAIRESCDVFFYDLALNLGIDRIHGYLSQFSLGSRTGIDIRGETKGLLPSREWKRAAKGEIWYPGETLISGIGQGFNLASPLQLAAAIAALANYGISFKPHLALATHQPATDKTSYFEPILNEPIPILKKSNWDYIIDTMEDVVHSLRGTARRIGYDAPYRIAGKTGTAQVFSIAQEEEYVKEEVELRLRDHALFVSFAPARNPVIAVAVIVENGGSGGGVAAPIARQVMDQYILGKS